MPLRIRAANTGALVRRLRRPKIGVIKSLGPFDRRGRSKRPELAPNCTENGQTAIEKRLAARIQSGGRHTTTAKGIGQDYACRHTATTNRQAAEKTGKDSGISQTAGPVTIRGIGRIV